MKLNKLIPWNWLKKEQEQEAHPAPVLRKDPSPPGSYPLESIHREIDNVFDQMLRGFDFPSLAWNRFGAPLTDGNWLKPALDVAAGDDAYTLSVELPGVDQKDVEVELNEDTLMIKGEKSQEHEEKNKGYHRLERSYGSFRRILSLPEDADRDAIRATFQNGVMNIKIPRKVLPESKSRQIEIKAA